PSLRHMTTQLLQEAAQVIPNQQLLINVVSKRVRQLGLGHRPMVETTPRMSLTAIALKEIIAGKLTYEELHESSDGAAAQEEIEYRKKGWSAWGFSSEDRCQFHRRD